MKISKSRLRQIIKEELENVLSEEEDLDNLAGEIVRRNKLSGKGKQMWLNPAVWYMTAEGTTPDRKKGERAMVFTHTKEALGEMLLAAWTHWNTPARPLEVGLSDEEKIALENLRPELAMLQSMADEGVLPGNEFGLLAKWVPKNRSPDAARATGFGKKMVAMADKAKEKVDPSKPADTQRPRYAPSRVGPADPADDLS